MATRNPSSVLVTGGAGFIGSAFIRYLLGDAGFDGSVINVDALTYAGNPDNLEAVADDARYTFVLQDIVVEGALEPICRQHAVDTIVHFAAETHVDRSIFGPDAFVQTNIMGTHRVLEVVRALPSIHYHHISTDEVYGSLGESGRFTEESPYQPNSPYAASKAASDHWVRAYGSTYGISTTLSNASNNYGPCQFPEKLIPLMISNLMEGKSLPIYGDGKNVRDWIHVEDHARAVWDIILGAPSGARYNIGGDAERTNVELVHMLIDCYARAIGESASELSKLIHYVQDRPGHDRRYAVDTSRLRTEQKWRPKYELSVGLEQTVKWYLDHRTWLERARSGAYREWIEKNYDGRPPSV